MSLFNFDNSYKNLSAELYAECLPTPVVNPQLVVFNDLLAQKLGIDTSLSTITELELLFSGNELPAGAASIAQAYAGHQFGHFNLLGDGRALLLGEQLTPNGQRFDLQLKGSGATPYSRRGDGRATLSAMLREYIISEAMHALGIPTTRSLAVVATGEAVYREQTQPGAVLTRVAASHIRVGTFQYIAQYDTTTMLEQFIDYCIKRHYPALAKSENKALALLYEVMIQQIDLIVNWMRVGFIHGVMNTDNVSIAGETIDYGPCAFMNSYKPDTVFSSIDTAGRYAFGNQPNICLWNITRFAECLLPCIHPQTEQAVALASSLIKSTWTQFDSKYKQMLAAKIGFEKSTEEVNSLANDLLKWMEKHQADYTNTFVKLMYPDLIIDTIYDNEDFRRWHKAWHELLANQSWEQTLNRMQTQNPIYIPRNQKVEEILAHINKTGELKVIHTFLKYITNPYSALNPHTPLMQAPKASDEQHYKTYCGT